ncbi:MAG: hypothetical protein ACTSWY_12300 [Promethearchaeota archaeon]
MKIIAIKIIDAPIITGICQISSFLEPGSFGFVIGTIFYINISFNFSNIDYNPYIIILIPVVIFRTTKIHEISLELKGIVRINIKLFFNLPRTKSE